MYLEDPESPSCHVTAASNDEQPSVAASSDHDEEPEPKPAPSTSTTTGKRQRTLFDMLGSTSNQDSKAISKKPKLAASGSGNKPSAAGTQPSAGSTGSLNSIPFSLAEYVASLTEDQKRLLELECETMGKSW